MRYLVVLALFSMRTFAGYSGEYFASEPHAQSLDPALFLAAAQVLPMTEKFLKLNRGVMPIEYEVFSDAINGLDLSYTLSSGESHSLSCEVATLRRLARKLRAGSGITEIQYSSETLSKLSELYLAACQTLGRAGCEIYADTSRLGSPGDRPFTPSQERMLKWAAFHTRPHARPWTTVGCDRLLAKGEPAARMVALSFMLNGFTRAEALQLLDRVVGPIIDGTFLRLRELHGGQ